MPSKNISMTDRLASFVDTKVASGKYAGASDYIQDLVRRDMEQDEERKAVKALLKARLATGAGEGVPLDDAGWGALLEKARQRVRSARP